MASGGHVLVKGGSVMYVPKSANDIIVLRDIFLSSQMTTHRCVMFFLYNYAFHKYDDRPVRGYGMSSTFDFIPQTNRFKEREV